MENDIRDLIRSKMKSFNYSLGDVKNRINHSALFEKYMKNEANLTIDLAEQIAIVLDFNPIFLLKKELEYMKKMDMKEYEVWEKKRLSKSEISIQKANENFEILYQNCIKNGVVYQDCSMEDFKKLFLEVTRINDIRYIKYEKYQLDYEEFSEIQKFFILFWVLNGEYKALKNGVKNKFHWNIVLDHLDEITRLKEEKNIKSLKEKIQDLCQKWNIYFMIEDEYNNLLDGFCKWIGVYKPLIVIKNTENAEELFDRFVVLISHLLSDLQKLNYYDTKLIGFGPEYDNYIHDYQIIKAERFMKNKLKMEIVR